MSEQSAGQPSPIRQEPVHLLPDALLHPDLQAQQQAPEIARNIPHYELDPLIDLLPLAVKFGEIKYTDVLNRLGSGQDGFVFQLRLQDLDLAVKFMYGSELPQEFFETFLARLPMDQEKKKEILAKVQLNENSDGGRKTYAQVGGFSLGHSIEPNYIDEPFGVFTHDGKAVGYAVPVVQGEAVSVGRLRIELHQSGFMQVLNRLRNGGVAVDVQEGSNNAIRTTYGSKIRLIDLSLQDPYTIDHDPRVSKEDEVIVPKKKDVGIGGPWDSFLISNLRGPSSPIRPYVAIRDDIKKYKQVRDLVKSGGNALTFEDVLAGRALISSGENLAACERAETQLEAFATFLGQSNVVYDKPNILMHIDGDTCQLSQNLGRDFTVSADGGRHGEKHFNYREIIHSGSQSGEEVEIQFDKNMLTYIVKHKISPNQKTNRQIDTVVIDSTTGKVQSTSMDSDSNGQASQAENNQVLAYFRSAFAIEDIASPEKVLHAVMQRLAQSKGM